MIHTYYINALFYRNLPNQSENVSMMQNLIPKMTDLAVTEVDEKQQQRLETFLNTKKKLGEPKNDPDEYEKIRELGMLIKVLS